jgi:tRNA(Glu) U13 pseudouridine synthase TruD
VYSIRDVLLPLPGTGVTLPANDIGELYKEILARDGLKMDDYGSGVIAYRMSGAYRRLLQVRFLIPIH